MPADSCTSCHEPLLIEIESDSDYEEQGAHSSSTPTSIPDDVELRCGCHYHWECFLDAYTVTECPNCSKDISSLSTTGQQQVLCTVRNEGGVQENFDILPSATEEAYLRTYPEERLGHAFLEFCREGDLDAIIHLIKDAELNDAEEEESDSVDILRYQGTFEGVEGSGLHVAIRYNQEEVAWLMLLLASTLDWAQFPPRVMQAMKPLNLSKEDRKAGVDVRSLRDSDGRTAATLAQEIGGIWSSWSESGRLSVG